MGKRRGRFQEKENMGLKMDETGWRDYHNDIDEDIDRYEMALIDAKLLWKMGLAAWKELQEHV